MFAGKSHILYVEGHDDTRTMTKLLLEHKGFRVTAVAKTEKCLELLKSIHYDLILLEHPHNGLSGVVLCSEIRKIDAETPIVFFSSRAFPAERAAVLKAGAQAYLVKPNDLLRLSNEIKQIIGKCEQVKNTPKRGQNQNRLHQKTLG